MAEPASRTLTDAVLGHYYQRRAERLESALADVAAQRGSPWALYQALAPHAAAGDARAAAAVDLLAPLVAIMARKSGYWYDPFAEAWVPRTASQQGIPEERLVAQLAEQMRDPEFARRHAAPAGGTGVDPIYDFLLEYPHPKLRGLRGRGLSCADRKAAAHEVLATSYDPRERQEAARALLEPCRRRR